MTEEIIIDGVNVAGCDFFAKEDLYNSYSGETQAYKGECGCSDDKMCKDIKNCCYKKQGKQLKRLEQENKELKEDLKSQQMTNLEQQEIALDYWNALEEIKNDFICFRTCILPFHTGDKDKIPHKMADVIQDYCESIRNKIDEVLK